MTTTTSVTSRREIAHLTGTPRPPVVKGLPLVGNLLDMANDPNQFFLRCYRTYGPIFRIRLLNRTVTVLAGPEANRFMVREGATYLRSREFWQGMVDQFGAKKGLINTDGEIHAALRKVMKRGFSRSAIQSRLADVLDTTDAVLARDWPVGATVPVVTAMQRLAADQLGIMATGRAPGDYVDDLRTFIRTILNVLVVRQRPRLFLYLPSFRRAQRRVFELGQQMIDAYDPSQADPDNPTLIDDVMAAHAKDPSLYVDGELMMAVLGPYFAGLDTVANTTSAMLYAILKQPELQAKLSAEIDAAFAAGPITPTTLQHMTVLHHTVMETLRMYPIAVAAMRNATQDFEFAGCQVLADEPLYMGITVSHYLDEFYPDPYRFDIERYAKPRLEHRQPGAFAPFSLGDHTCLGAGMAEVQIMLTMARLFHQRQLALTPPDYILKQKVAPTPGPEQGFKVRVIGQR